MPQISTENISTKIKSYLYDQYIYSQLLKDPAKVVDLFDIYNQLWRNSNNNYSKSFTQEMFKSNKNLAEEFKDWGQLLSLKFPQLTAVSAIADLIKTYKNGEDNDRTELGKTLIREDTNSEIYKMVTGLNDYETAMAEIIVSNQNTSHSSYADTAKDFLILIDDFKKNDLDIPSSTLELLQKAPTNSVLLSGILDKVQERAITEGNDNYDEILAEVLEEQSLQIEEIQQELSEYFKTVWNEKLELLEAQNFAFKMNEARSWGAILGMLIGLSDPKLGKAITDGSKAIVDGYESYAQMAASGYSASSFAGWIGAIIAVIQIINSYNEKEAEKQQTELLFEALDQINQNINYLR
ncbi:MAG TPA: hypothetical protein PKY82_25400, partial [Pyrinomonadaceae bacterium]|nr:hypothetical protein [Pyrinomonadaceae bacterium]